jgi:hypothetical protein
LQGTLSNIVPFEDEKPRQMGTFDAVKPKHLAAKAKKPGYCADFSTFPVVKAANLRCEMDAISSASARYEAQNYKQDNRPDGRGDNRSDSGVGRDLCTKSRKQIIADDRAQDPDYDCAHDADVCGNNDVCKRAGDKTHDDYKYQRRQIAHFFSPKLFKSVYRGKLAHSPGTVMGRTATHALQRDASQMRIIPRKEF